MSDKELETLAFELYEAYSLAQGMLPYSDWDSISEKQKLGWIAVSKFIFQNIENIHQRERDINHNGHGGYNR